MPNSRSTVPPVGTVKVNVTSQQSQYRSRTIHNDTVYNGESTTWRLDLYKSNNLSFVQVLNLAIKNYRMIKHKVVSKPKHHRPPPQVKNDEQYYDINPNTVLQSSYVYKSSQKLTNNCKMQEYYIKIDFKSCSEMASLT